MAEAVVEQRPISRWVVAGALAALLATFLGGAALGWLAWGAPGAVAAAGTGALSRVPAGQRETSQPAAPAQTSSPPTAQAAIPTTDLEHQIEQVFHDAGPGVVNITSRSLEYDFFLNAVPREGTGSGFFYDDQGHIVTNYHVVANADELQVTLADGRNLPAQLVGSDPANDLAVIRVELPAEEIQILPIGDSSALRVGQFVIAIGNPFGLERTLTVGVVSALKRVIESPNQTSMGEVIQSDAAINPGNSGGPLLNLGGQVVGVNSAIFSPSGASAGIGFAIPARTVLRVVPELIAHKRYPHPSLDVRTYALSSRQIEALRGAGLDIPVDRGLLIAELVQGGAAEQAGLRGGQQLARLGNVVVPIGGDLIVAVDGRPIATDQDLIVYLETETRVGDTVEVTVIRDGEELKVPVVLGEA